MNSNIFNIEGEYLSIIDALEESGGELTPELEEALAINAENRDRKMQAYVNVIKQKQADIALAKDEINRLRELSQSNEKVIKRLKDTLLQALEVFDLRNNKGNLYHKLPNAIMYARTKEIFEVKYETIGAEEEETFEDVLDFVVTDKLDAVQFEAVKDALDKYGIPNVTYKVAASKDKFKEVIAGIEKYSDDTIEKEEKLAYLNNFAELKEVQFLTIR